MKKSQRVRAAFSAALLASVSAPAFADLSPEMEAIVNVIDENCSGNDNGHVWSIKPSAFDAKKAMKEMRAKGMCAQGRVYSENREDGAAMAIEHLLGREHDAKCVKDQIGQREQRMLRELIEDSTNLGVFASVYGGDAESEACLNFHFEIYRADGTVVRFVFDHTD